MSVNLPDDFDFLYVNAISYFRDIKLLDGPLGLSSSLRRHPQLVSWLKSHAKSQLISIEESLDIIPPKS